MLGQLRSKRAQVRSSTREKNVCSVHIARPRRVSCQANPQCFLRLGSSFSSSSNTGDSHKRLKLSTSSAITEFQELETVSSPKRTLDSISSNELEEMRRMLEDMTHSSHRSHPVLQLMQQRVQDGTSPGQRKDNFKLGLVVEGGGMRGIVTGAMLMGLLDMGLTGVFDAVYGASAGAINATYFLTGQPEGLDIYTDHLAPSDRFLSLKRYWGKTSAPVMNLDFLLDEVMHEVIPLDWHSVLNSHLPLKVVASSLTTLRSEVLDNFDGRRDLVECLKASANVPEIVGPPRRHRGHDLVDAAVFEPLPVKAALKDGCTHVLALCSRPHSLGPAWGKYLTRTLHNAVKYWLLNPPYMREAWRVEPLHSTHQGQPIEDLLITLLMHGRALELDAALDLAGSSSSSSLSSGDSSPSRSSSSLSSTDGAELMTAFGGDGVWGCGHVYPLYPGSAASFAPICTNIATLQQGRQEGYRSVHRLMRAMQHIPVRA